MSYHERIEAALEHVNANIPQLSDPSDRPQSEADLVTEPTSRFTFFNGLPDDAALHLRISENFYVNKVMADEVSRNEFGRLLRDYYDVMNKPFEPEAEEEFYEHESQHLDLARQLGARGQIGIALHILPKPGGNTLAHYVQPLITLGNLIQQNSTMRF